MLYRVLHYCMCNISYNFLFHRTLQSLLESDIFLFLHHGNNMNLFPYFSSQQSPIQCSTVESTAKWHTSTMGSTCTALCKWTTTRIQSACLWVWILLLWFPYANFGDRWPQCSHDESRRPESCTTIPNKRNSFYFERRGPTILLAIHYNRYFLKIRIIWSWGISRFSLMTSPCALIQKLRQRNNVYLCKTKILFISGDVSSMRCRFLFPRMRRKRKSVIRRDTSWTKGLLFKFCKM